VLEALIKAGALDDLGAHRRGLMTVLEQAMQAAEQQAWAEAQGQTDLFGGGGARDSHAELDEAAWKTALDTAEWSQPQLLSWEKETLGLYLSGHPIDRFRYDLQGLAAQRLVDLKPGHRRAAGLIVALRFLKSRRGRMAILTLDDNTARVEVTVYNEVLETAVDKLAVDTLVLVEGECSVDDFSGDPALNAQLILSLDEARQRYARMLVIALDSAALDRFTDAFRTILRAYGKGTCPVAVEYDTGSAHARLRLGDDWRVTASEALLEQLRAHVGAEAVRVEY
jgi:DNA polymerase-3 subunit alpha